MDDWFAVGCLDPATRVLRDEGRVIGSSGAVHPRPACSLCSSSGVLADVIGVRWATGATAAGHLLVSLPFNSPRDP